jgi:hypothetical protein
VSAGTAFEIVLDQKLHEVGTWAGVNPRPASSAATMPDPALRTALWTGALANPFGVHAFAARVFTTLTPDRPSPGVAASFVVEPAPEQPAVSRTVRPARPSVVVRIQNMQQRLALAEFAEAGLPRDARDVALDDLKQAFRTLARAYHPDRHPADSEHARACHAARFGRIAAAYEILTESVCPAA